MIASSADNKAITTKDNRLLLGELIKGKMLKNCLNRYEQITSETLKEYGRDYIELHKISEGVYYLEF